MTSLVEGIRAYPGCLGDVSLGAEYLGGNWFLSLVKSEKKIEERRSSTMVKSLRAVYPFYSDQLPTKTRVAIATW